MEFKDCLKPTKWKILLLLIYLFIYLFIWINLFYNSSLSRGESCDLDGGCYIPPHISLTEYVFNGTFYNTSGLFQNPYWFLIITIIVMGVLYCITSVIFYINENK